MTLLSHRARFIFLKTHKTASTSLEAALEPLCLPEGAETGAHYRAEAVTEAGAVGARGDRHVKAATWRNHMSAAAVRRLTGRAVWRDYAKISVVRNPYDRMVSMFQSRLSAEERAALADAPFAEVRAAFARWLPSSAQSNNTSKLVLRRRYCIDHILYFERLEADFAALAEALSMPGATLPRFKSDRRLRPEPWRAFYDDRTRRMVARGSAFELAFFGYSFDEAAPRDQTPSRRGLRLAATCPHMILNVFRRPTQSIASGWPIRP